jgi:dephospho-CoA kinase
MKIIGLTGGIGSGKSTIGKWFLEKGIPVYDSDKEAKDLMNNSQTLKEQITELLGPEAYIINIYNRPYVAQLVFQNKDLLSQLNAIVHPAVFEHFHNWIKQQNSPFIVKEAAILFESGSYKDCDYILSVVADESIRLKRVMARDEVTEQQVKDRIANQWTDEQRIEHSNFVIENNKNLEVLREEFEDVYKKLLKEVQSS